MQQQLSRHRKLPKMSATSCMRCILILAVLLVASMRACEGSCEKVDFFHSVTQTVEDTGTSHTCYFSPKICKGGCTTTIKYKSTTYDPNSSNNPSPKRKCEITASQCKALGLNYETYTYVFCIPPLPSTATQAERSISNVLSPAACQCQSHITTVSENDCENKYIDN